MLSYLFIQRTPKAYKARLTRYAAVYCGTLEEVVLGEREAERTHAVFPECSEVIDARRLLPMAHGCSAGSTRICFY